VSIVRPPCREEPRHGDLLVGGGPRQPRGAEPSQPDGAGIGVFDKDGAPVVDKQPLAAWNDPAFAEEAPRAARHHLRGPCPPRQHGFEHCGQHPPVPPRRALFAHNGVVQGTDQLDAHLRELGAGALVHGDTDSERVFALVSAETARHEGDVGAGLRAALSWVSEHLGVYSLNLVLTTPHELWAFATRRPTRSSCSNATPGARVGGPGRDRQPAPGTR